MRTYTTVTVIGDRLRYYGRHLIVVRDEAARPNRWTVWSVPTHEGSKCDAPLIVGRALPFREAKRLLNELSTKAVQRAKAHEHRDEMWTRRNAAREKKMGET